MVITKVIGTVFGQAAKTVQKRGTNAVGKVIIKGAAPLKADVAEFSAAATRWTKPAEEYIPNITRDAKGLALPMHHDLSGDNLRIRSIIKGIKKNSLSDTDEYYLKSCLKEMHETDKEFLKLIPTEKDIIGYRGRTTHPIIPRFNEDFEIISKAKVGDIIVPDEAYSYLGIHRGLAENWCCRNNRDNLPTIMYIVRIPKGAKVSRNLEHGGEIVMPRGAQYKVISKEVQGNHTEITLEYILPQKDNLQETETFMKKFNIPFSEKE